MQSQRQSSDHRWLSKRSAALRPLAGANHPHLYLRELDSPLFEDWIAGLRAMLESRDLKPRSFNRRVSAVSSLYRWASEPRSAAGTCVPRNPIPRRTGMTAAKRYLGLWTSH